MNIELITEKFNQVDSDAWAVDQDLMQAVKDSITAMNSGLVRVAYKKNDAWHVNAWLKQAILIYLKTMPNSNISLGELAAYDKVPLKFNQDNIATSGVRVVPPATVRFGAYLAKNVVLMPSYINIGAFVDSGTMIDTWATIGSCAQIGKNVHISGGVGIGGVLEPLQAKPTIIEDNCFIGARSEIVEGIIVRTGAVISMGVMLSQSTKIYDRVNDKFYQGEVPEYAVVVPGSIPSSCGKCNVSAAIIVKYVDAKTRAKVGINELLRY